MCSPWRGDRPAAKRRSLFTVNGNTGRPVAKAGAVVDSLSIASSGSGMGSRQALIPARNASHSARVRLWKRSVTSRMRAGSKAQGIRPERPTALQKAH